MSYENIKIDCDGDLIFMSVGKYKMFMSHGKEGKDAKDLYEHLMFTARLQGTNSVKATDTYLMKGLGFGREKLKKSKALLHKMELIEYIQNRKEDGTFKDRYIAVKASSRWTNYPPNGEPVDQFQPTNALTNNINALTNKENASPEEMNDSSADNKKIKNNNQEKDDRENELFKRLKDFFSNKYFEYHNQKISNWPKEMKQLKLIVKKDSEKVISEKVKIFEFMIQNPKNSFEASICFLPSTFNSMWDKLVPRRDITQKQQAEKQSLYEAL